MTTTSRADLHVHSTASQLSKLGVQRALGLPECATPPEEVYALARRRGMDFVTITDHDTIAGAQEIAHLPGTFTSVELTADFRGEPQAVHVLCLGIDPDQFARLCELSGDLAAVAEHLHEQEIACALAHPFYAVAAPLTARHRRLLARLFPTWEVRNGARAPELNAPAALYIETHGGTGVGGSDDHAGVDVGRTYTQTPAAATAGEFLAHLRAGRATALGHQGSAAKWAHAAMAIAVRALGCEQGGQAPDPRAVLAMAMRVVSEGDARSGAIGADLGPDDARALLMAWLDTVELPADGPELLAMLQADDFSHAALQRRARRAHERRLGRAVRETLGVIAGGGNPVTAVEGLFAAAVPVIPYAPAVSFLGREKARLTAADAEPRRVALVVDGVGSMHGVTRTVQEIRERDVPGFDVEVLGTDQHVDRRLSAVAEVEVPFYPGLSVGVPGLPAVVEALADGRYDLVHLCSPGPAGLLAGLVARMTGVPVMASYHTELAAYAGLRSADARLEAIARVGVGAFYGAATRVLSPSPASDGALRSLGVPDARIGRWARGVDQSRFSPDLRDATLLPGEVTVLYSGRLTREKGADLLADAFLAAHARDPRLHLCIAGGGPEEQSLRDRLGEHATFLGWLDGEDLARAYASADMFLFASRTDTFGQVLLEAQASGLPVVAVAEGGPCSIVADGVTGLLRPPDPHALGHALACLARDPQGRARMAQASLGAVRKRTWELSMAQLAEGYRRVLAPGVAEASRAA